VAAAAIYRLTTGTVAVHGLPVLVVSAVAGATMSIGAIILGGDHGDDDDLHVRAVWLDTAADAAAAGGVAVTGAIIWATGGWYWLDSVVAFAIASIISFHALRLLHQIRTTLGTRGSG
jgi:cobalt-zinc-cadmium efflux system protein